MFNYSKRRSTLDAPIWDIFYDENCIGCITNFPLDGPTATVKLEIQSGTEVVKVERTVDASTVNMVFNRAVEAHHHLIEDMVNRIIPC